MKAKTLNKTKSNNSMVIIKDEIFGIEPNVNVILRVVNWQLANKQKGNHKVKSRSEVKSTTAKLDEAVLKLEEIKVSSDGKISKK